MKYLVDTNVISELVSAKPHKNVLYWFENIPSHVLYLSVLTLGEIRKGIEKLNENISRKRKLLYWLEHELVQVFEARILSITVYIADRWGRLHAGVKRTLPTIDGLIAATALHHDMVLVARNVDYFSDCAGLEVINPCEI